MDKIRKVFIQLLCLMMTLVILQPSAAGWTLSESYILPNWLNLNPISSIGVVEVFVVSNGDDNRLAWCIEPDVLAKTGSSYIINDDAKRLDAENIILNWYANYRNNEWYDTMGGYYAVQVAIWGKMKGVDPAGLSIADGADEATALSLRSLASELYNSNYTYDPDPLIYFNGTEYSSDASFTLKPDLYLVGNKLYYRVSVEANRENGGGDFDSVVSITNINNYIVKKTNGSVISVSNNSFTLGNKDANGIRAYIYIPVTESSNNSKITVSNDMELLSTTAFDGSISNSQKMQALWTKNKNKSVTFNLNWVRMNTVDSNEVSLKVMKTGKGISDYTLGEDGLYSLTLGTVPVKGAAFTFSITDENWNPQDKYTVITDENGLASFNATTDDSNIYTDKDGDFVYLEVAEILPAYGYTTKWTSYSDAEGTIYDPASGHSILSLPVGKKDNGIFTTNSEIYKTFENITKTFKINVKKTDLEGNAIEGVKFGLYTTEEIAVAGKNPIPSGALVGVGTTDANGNLVFDSSSLNLIANQSYFLKEIETVGNYDLNVYDAQIDGTNAEVLNNGVLISFYDFMWNEEESKEINVTFRNDELPVSHTLTIKKVDGDTSDPVVPLAGAKISVANQNNISETKTGVTDGNGTLTFTLEAGTYIVTESEAPEGYSKAPQQVVVLDSDKEITMKDYKYPQASFIIAKRVVSADIDGNPILDSDGNKIDAEGYGSQDFSFTIKKTINGQTPQNDGHSITVSDSDEPILLNNKNFNGNFKTINVVYDKEWEDNQWNSVTYEVFENDPVNSETFGKDVSSYTVTYTAIKDSEGKVAWDVTYDNSNPNNSYGENVFLFENTFRPNPYEFNINITKNVTNEVANVNHTVSFVATKEPASDTKTATITGDEINGKTSTITYTITDPGHYSYKVRENSSQDYYINDASYYTIDFDIVTKDKNLVVTDDGFTIRHFDSEGTELSSSSNESTANVVFTNEYRSSGTLNIPVEKTFEGNDFENRKFTFRASCGSENYSLELNEENGYTGSFAIPLKAGTNQTCYVFESSSYDEYETNNTRYKITYDAVDNGLGTITGNITSIEYDNKDENWQQYLGSTINFENIYKGKVASLEFFIEKQIGNLTSTSAKFTVKIEKDGLLNGEVVFDEVGKIQNGKSVRSYTLDNLSVGHYEYIIEEDSSNPIDGWTYDDSIYTLIFDVNKVDDRAGGWTPEIQNIRVVDNDGNLVNFDEKTLVFNNTYEITPVSEEITIKKNWTDASGNSLNSNFTTTYSVETASGEPYDDVTYEILTSKTGITGNGTQNIKFTFNKAGTYTYNIKESNIESSYITKDDSTYEVTFDVKDVNSNLVATVDVKKDNVAYPSDGTSFEENNNQIIFTNIYEPEPVSIDYKIIKQWENVDDPNVFTSEFEITDTSGQVTFTPVTIVGEGEKTQTFEFTKAGEYKFEVKETRVFSEQEENKPYESNVKKSTEIKTLTFNVLDVNGQLTIENPDTDRNLVFENNYVIKPAESTITIKKVWKTGNKENNYFEDSKNEDIKDYISTFSITPQGVYDGVTIEGDEFIEGVGSTDLSFEFSKEGTYIFEIKETSTISGTEKDKTPHTVKFEVVKNGLAGLEVSTTVDNQNSNSITFENHLIYNTYKLPIRIVKGVLNEVKQDDEVSVSFNVLVKQGEDEILNKTYSITNEEGTLNGEFVDVEIPFYKEGEYTVTISERTAPEEMTKDNTAYKFNLTLVRDKAVLSADSVKVYKNAKLLDNANVINENGQYEIKFVNEYPAPYRIVLEKHVTGKDEYTEEFTISDGTNEYTLSGFSSGVTSKTINLALNPGTNEFEFSELDKGLPGWNYDSTVYRVSIIATKNEDGSRWKYEPHFYKVADGSETEISNTNPLVWSNSYGAKPTNVNINIQKKWEGLNEDEAKYFNSTVSVNGEKYILNGNESLSYSKRITEAGTYTFEIKEESFESKEKYLGTVSKDSNVYNFTVKVEDKNGVLEIVESNIKDVTFKNTYTWNALNIHLPITKTVKNEPSTLSQFEILVNKDKLLFKGSGTKNYQIGDLSLGIHTFEIKEKNTKEANYEYDDSTYKVVYTVSKNGLNKVYTYAITKDGKNASKVEFINTYNKPSPKPETPPTKPSNNSPVVNTSVK